MKLNWLGKAFMGAAGAYAVTKIVENATSGGDDDEFTDSELHAMLGAARNNDYSLFTRLYRNRRPWADDANVYASWGFFVNKIR